MCGDPWSKREKNTRKSACDCAKAQLSIIYKPASFEEPVSETRCRYRFAPRCFRGRGCTAAGRSGCSAGKAKKSSHPWHFWYWSLRRNELECTNFVHWTEALHHFSSHDAIIVVGSVLEKHFGDDFTRDQEKEITFKRWPPGYQSWKLGLALNGLKRKEEGREKDSESTWQCLLCLGSCPRACLGCVTSCFPRMNVYTTTPPSLSHPLVPTLRHSLPSRSTRTFPPWPAAATYEKSLLWSQLFSLIRPSPSCAIPLNVVMQVPVASQNIQSSKAHTAKTKFLIQMRKAPQRLVKKRKKSGRTLGWKRRLRKDERICIFLSTVHSRTVYDCWPPSPQCRYTRLIIGDLSTVNGRWLQESDRHLGYWSDESGATHAENISFVDGACLQ